MANGVDGGLYNLKIERFLKYHYREALKALRGFSVIFNKGNPAD